MSFQYVFSIVRDVPDLLLLFLILWQGVAVMLLHVCDATFGWLLFAIKVPVVVALIHLCLAKFTCQTCIETMCILLLLRLQSWKQSRGLVLFARSQAIELLELDSRIDRD